MRSFGFASNKYKEVDKQYGVGSEFWTHGSVATGLLAGVLGGNVTGGLAAGSAPYMAALVKDATKGNDAARIALHAIVSGALASAQGANLGAAAAGGLVAAASSDVLAQAFYGKPASELVGDEKTLISNLVTMLGSAAGGMAGGDGLSIASGGNAARVEVENNSLSSKNVLDMHKELIKAEVNDEDKLAIYEKYAEISKKNREEAIAESCSGDPFCANAEFAQIQAGNSIANSLNRLPIFSDLSSEDLAQLDRFVLAENEDSARAIYQSLPSYVKLALNGKEALEEIGLKAVINGGYGLAALGVIGKNQSAKGSSLPTPTAIPASNGLNYVSNPKHTPGQMGYHRNAGTEPKDSIKLFGNSVASGKKRYALDSDGNVHQFTNTNDGTWHWSGSTGDKSAAVSKKDIPSDVKKILGLPGKWR
ncbi:Possible hemagglutinin (DUF638) [Pragia fontium]|nr:Possible hemagglutinin (DUF638) [Pragia fontium]